MELNSGPKCFANGLGICGIRDLVISVPAPKLNWHANTGESVWTHRESQAWCRHDAALILESGKKASPIFGVPVFSKGDLA